MDSKTGVGHGLTIGMENQEKMTRESRSSQVALRVRPIWANKPTTIRRIIAAGSLVLLVLLGFSTLRDNATCHGPPPTHVDEETSSFASRLRTATPDSLQGFLQKYFPERHTGEDIPRTDVATTLLRLARRQDNTTASSTPQPTPSPSPSPSPSPPPSTSSSSSPPPPPPRTEPSPPPPPPPTTPTTAPTATTTRSTATTATTTNQPPPPPPPVVSGPTVTNPGTSASPEPNAEPSPSQEPRVQDTASSPGSSVEPATTTTEDGSRTTNEPRPPSTINGGRWASLCFRLGCPVISCLSLEALSSNMLP
ncbi:hypothetical protein B0T14DRAFT_108263 [Immersiella caudata]|uniref:Uncharacterized protein n=1 Tax=Immersiella caudata TaxID=314043 RepID=A0AA39X3D5_9PEZI|nr:hypothetical protein B0T14DRAFT_108263 [Immersiella caudata]